MTEAIYVHSEHYSVILWWLPQRRTKTCSSWAAQRLSGVCILRHPGPGKVLEYIKILRKWLKSTYKLTQIYINKHIVRSPPTRVVLWHSILENFTKIWCENFSQEIGFGFQRGKEARKNYFLFERRDFVSVWINSFLWNIAWCQDLQWVCILFISSNINQRRLFNLAI